MYLIWNLRDILDIANRTGKIEIGNSFNQKFDKLLTFLQLYDFLKAHKEYSYNNNIPHGSCLCEICENCFLLAKGLSKKLEDPLPTNPHDLVEKFACDLNIKKCALNQCECCSSETYDFGLKKCYSNSESSEYDEEPDEVNYFFWTKIDKRITKANYSAYNQHKNSLTNDELLVHVDFAENYRNDQLLFIIIIIYLFIVDNCKNLQ